jgi:gluconokinase
MNAVDRKRHGVAWVIMGVSGCGKSEMGQRLARMLDVPFVEGDSFHPEDNVRKMSAGISLTDADRAGWLASLRDEIARACAAGSDVVLACSALKRACRDLLRVAGCDVRFVHLRGARDVIASRMRARSGPHAAALLDSQLRDLEPLQGDERGVTLDNDEPPAVLVARVQAYAGIVGIGMR